MRRTTPTTWRVRGRLRTVMRSIVAVVFAASAAACSVAAAGSSSDHVAQRARTTTTTTSTTTTTTTTTITTTTTTTTSTTATTAPPTTVVDPTTTTAPPLSSSPDDRDHVLTGFAPYATVAGITLHHPAAIVEIIGLHQSSHEGAIDQVFVDGVTWGQELNTRGRGTSPRGAADIVSQPGTEIRSPVTGTVIRATAYDLYCTTPDEFMVVVPDDNPALEVKLLHIVGLAVGVGDHVVAGETVVARHANVLPFASQVDRLTANPSWPHVHVEVVDPSVPNIPNGGTGNPDC